MKLGRRQKHILFFIARFQPVSIGDLSRHLKIPRSIVASVIISLYDKKCIVATGCNSWRIKI